MFINPDDISILVIKFVWSEQHNSILAPPKHHTHLVAYARDALQTCTVTRLHEITIILTTVGLAQARPNNVDTTQSDPLHNV